MASGAVMLSRFLPVFAYPSSGLSRALRRCTQQLAVFVHLVLALPVAAQQQCQDFVVQCFENGNCTGSSFDPNLVEFPVAGGPTGTEFSWTASFYAYPDAGAAEPTIEVFLWIELFSPGSIPASLKLEWEQGIEQTWSNRHGLLAPDGTVYGVNVDVEFIDPGPLGLVCSNLRVTVQDGPGAFDLAFWYINPTSTLSQAALAAHEIGHLLGNFDEYPSGAVDPNDTSYWNETGNIMAVDGADVVLERHYGFLVDWANQNLAAPGGSFTLAPAAFIGSTATAIPLLSPPILVLQAVLLALVVRCRKKRHFDASKFAGRRGR